MWQFWYAAVVFYAKVNNCSSGFYICLNKVWGEDRTKTFTENEHSAHASKPVYAVQFRVSIID